MVALIFGAGGQDGYYLNLALKEKGIEGICFSRVGNVGSLIHIHNVSNLSHTESLIKEYKPKYVFHLAARSSTKHDALFENHATISTGALNILESVRLHSPETKVFITGSGVQFENYGPIDENTPFEASSPYSIARIQSVYAARYYRSIGIKAYVGYLFHHESPLRTPLHISRMIIDAARRIANGSDETLILGDTSVVKEWTFAGDVVHAILDLVNQNNIFEAVIGTGDGHSIKEWIELCFDMVGCDWHKHIKGTNFKAEYKSLISKPLLIKSLGWKPKIGFVDLARIMTNNCH
jgi:GDPmannose 4,6-dehydratase